MTWCASPDFLKTRLSGDFPYLSRLVNQHWVLTCFSSSLLSSSSSSSLSHSRPNLRPFLDFPGSLISRHFY